MKSKIIFSISLFCLFCSSNLQAAETKNIVVTIKPLHSLVSGVIGNSGKATLLISNNYSPHNFQLKPSQIKNLQKANIVFYIDNSFETFLNRSFKNIPHHVRKASIAQKAGLTILSHRQSGKWQNHQHEIHQHQEEEEGHDHDHQEHNHSHHDMHLWLDPNNAQKIVEFIAKELSKIYPENRNLYHQNAKNLIAKIADLNQELKKSLNSSQNKPYIVFHDAYQYFERAYKLNAAGSILLEPDQPTSPQRIKEIRQRLKDSKARCVFREPQFSDRLINIIIENTNAKSATLDPIGSNIKSGPKLYFSLMRNLANNLKNCLSDATM